MGISGLLPALKSIQKPRQLKDFAGQTIAIDAYGWLHKGTVTCTVDLVLGKPTKRHIEYCMRLVRMLQHFKVVPYVVFDGDYLPSKAHTEEDRKKKREKSKELGTQLLNAGKVAAANAEFQKAVDVTPEMAHDFIVELRKAGVKFVVAPYEADAQMVYLERKGKVSAILSEDSDLLVFGAKCLLTKLDKYGNCIEVNQKDFTACRDLFLIGWTEREFRHMAILSGCDYLASIKGLGLKTAHRLLRKHKTVEQVIRILRFDGKYSVPPDYLESFARAEITFLHQRVYCPDAASLVYHTRPQHPLSEQSSTYIGEHISSRQAIAIAKGLLNPITRKLFTMANPFFHHEKGVNAQGDRVPYADNLDSYNDAQLYRPGAYDATNTQASLIFQSSNAPRVDTPRSSTARAPLGELRNHRTPSSTARTSLGEFRNRNTPSSTARTPLGGLRNLNAPSSQQRLNLTGQNSRRTLTGSNSRNDHGSSSVKRFVPGGRTLSSSSTAHRSRNHVQVDILSDSDDDTPSKRQKHDAKPKTNNSTEDTENESNETSPYFTTTDEAPRPTRIRLTTYADHTNFLTGHNPSDAAIQSNYLSYVVEDALHPESAIVHHNGYPPQPATSSTAQVTVGSGFELNQGTEDEIMEGSDGETVMLDDIYNPPPQAVVGPALQVALGLNAPLGALTVASQDVAGHSTGDIESADAEDTTFYSAVDAIGDAEDIATSIAESTPSSVDSVDAVLINGLPSPPLPSEANFLLSAPALNAEELPALPPSPAIGTRGSAGGNDLAVVDNGVVHDNVVRSVVTTAYGNTQRISATNDSTVNVEISNGTESMDVDDRLPQTPSITDESTGATNSAGTQSTDSVENVEGTGASGTTDNMDVDDPLPPTPVITDESTELNHETTDFVANVPLPPSPRIASRRFDNANLGLNIQQRTATSYGAAVNIKGSAVLGLHTSIRTSFHLPQEVPESVSQGRTEWYLPSPRLPRPVHTGNVFLLGTLAERRGFEFQRQFVGPPPLAVRGHRLAVGSVTPALDSAISGLGITIPRHPVDGNGGGATAGGDGVVDVGEGAGDN